ncbi:unnamed protein product [Diamesa hyperborea]
MVNNHHHEVEQNNTVELESRGVPYQNTILYIIIGMLMVAVVFLTLLLIKMKLVRSSFIVAADKQKQFSNLELKETITDNLVEYIEPYATPTDTRNGESGLYSEIQNDVTETYAGYVDVEDIKRDKVVSKNIADLYSVINKNQR